MRLVAKNLEPSYEGNEALLREALQLEPIPEAPKRMPMQWAELDGREPPPRKWIIDHWLGNTPTLLAGAGGIGKSLLAQTIATALATGRRYLDNIFEPVKTLMWACEDDHNELWRRQVAINTYFGLSMLDLEGKLIIEPRLGKENGLFLPAYGVPTWTPVMDELREQVNDYKVGSLFVDNIGHTFGCSENDRHHVTSYMNGLAGLTPDPLAMVLLGHPAKATGSEFSGSTAWENAVRMRWYMGTKLPDQPDGEGEDDESVRYLAKRKTNYTIKDYRKLTYLDGVLRTEGEMGPITARYSFGERREAAEKLVLFAIEKMAEVKVYGRIGPTSPEHLPKKIIQMNLSGGYTRKDLGEAMNRLLMAGRIHEIPVGLLNNRMPRMGVALK
jgi:hypothetical protein